MAAKKKSPKIKSLPPKFQVWVDARRRFRLSDAQVQMARELGLNPKKLGSIANHDQEIWKAPLPEFIEALYFKHFGRECPEVVVTIEQMLQKKKMKQKARAQAKVQRKADAEEAGGDGAKGENASENPF